MFPSSRIPRSMGGIDQLQDGCLHRGEQSFGPQAYAALGRVLATKKSLSPRACTDWVSACPHPDRGDGHDSPSLANAGYSVDNKPPVHLW